MPVGKKPDTLDSAKALGDRTNMIFNGTSVTQGTGRAIVTGTGMNTQVGKIADMLSQTDDEDTPLQKEMTHVSKILGIAVCIIAAVVLVALFITQASTRCPTISSTRCCWPFRWPSPQCRKSCDDSDGCSRARRAAHGQAQRHRQEAELRGNAGIRFGDLLRQDRYAHA